MLYIVEKLFFFYVDYENVVCHDRANVEIYTKKNGRHNRPDSYRKSKKTDLENIYLDTNISILCHLEAEILIEIGVFIWQPSSKIQYGRHKYCEKAARLFCIWIQHIVNFLNMYSFILFLKNERTFIFFHFQ